MLKVEVKFSDDGLRDALARVQGDLAATTEMHQAMAMGVEETVRGHLLGLNSRSPRTGFYAKAARSVESSWDASAGTVLIPHRGMAQRYYGGLITPQTVDNLAVPTANVPVRGDERMRPREMKDLAYIPRSPAAKPNVTGYLVEGKKNRKGTRLVPKTRAEGGRLMFVLLSEVNQNEDPTVLPSDATLTTSATEAAEDFLAASLNENDLS
jgi:hypothetical protein